MKPEPRLLRLLASKTEAFVTDAATDEMKAGRLLSGRDVSAYCSPVLTSLKFHCAGLSGPA